MVSLVSSPELVGREPELGALRAALTRATRRRARDRRGRRRGRHRQDAAHRGVRRARPERRLRASWSAAAWTSPTTACRTPRSPRRLRTFLRDLPPDRIASRARTGPRRDRPAAARHRADRPGGRTARAVWPPTPDRASPRRACSGSSSACSATWGPRRRPCSSSRTCTGSTAGHATSSRSSPATSSATACCWC